MAVRPRAIKDSPALYGIVLFLGSVVVYSLMSAVVKLAGGKYPVGQIIFFRNLIAFLPISIFIMHAGGLHVLRTKRPLAHFLRSFLGISAMGVGFWAYKFLPLPEAIALEMAFPLFLTLFAVPSLGERIGKHRAAAVIIGFIGVLIITQPGQAVFQWAALLSVADAILVALGAIAIRRLSRTEHPMAIAFYFTVYATLAGVATAPFGWALPDMNGLLLLVAVGVLGGIGQVLSTIAWRTTEAATLAPYQYTGLIFAALWGFLFWGDVPAPATIFGASVIALAGIYISHREVKARQITPVEGTALS